MTGFVLKDAEDDGSFDLLNLLCCSDGTAAVINAAHRSSALYRGIFHVSEHGNTKTNMLAC